MKIGKRNIATLLLLALAIIYACRFTACSGDADSKFRLVFPFGRKYDYNRIRVVKVFDGDTIGLENREKVRLIGIDTPENWHSDKLDRDVRRTGLDHRTIMKMGEKSKRFTTSLVNGKCVRVEFDIEKRDRYRRLLAYVYLPDGRMLNAELLKEGYAKIYTFPLNVKYVDLFTRLEREARQNKKGFWK